MIVTIGMYIVSALWGVRITANLLSFIHLWYLKEYRFDRMTIHLGTQEGKRLLFLPWKLPPLTPKTIVLFVAGALSCSGLFLILSFPILVKLLIIDVALFPVTIALVLLTKIPTFAYHELIIWKAMKMLRVHAPMQVIGITGSYGKTSTKEILFSILRTKYKTLKTQASKNSPIGIAEIVLRSLKADHEIFIVEMGAYKRGEIARMAEMVWPEIGIITAINAQHQDLFRTIETTMEAKYELIAGLVGKRIAIMNADNTYVSTLSKWAKRDKRTVRLYSTRGAAGNGIEYWASHIVQKKDSLSFRFHHKGTTRDISVSLIGTHQVSNILAAIAAACECGMTIDEIAQACRDITPFPKTMEPTKRVNGAVCIDDTFNNNPDAARAALTYLATRPHRRILVFQPMIELGSYTAASHEDVGSYAANICDEIILTNKNFYDSFIKGVNKVKADLPVYVMGEKEAALKIRQSVKIGDSVLFKGKEAGLVLRNL
jgi:UDP-N-acetylmuramoyl-tripeptide--D-alanyl-D-alanine ligase